jgi:hypothetical protein
LQVPGNDAVVPAFIHLKVPPLRVSQEPLAQSKLRRLLDYFPALMAGRDLARRKESVQALELELPQRPREHP